MALIVLVLLGCAPDPSGGSSSETMGSSSGAMMPSTTSDGTTATVGPTTSETSTGAVTAAATDGSSTGTDTGSTTDGGASSSTGEEPSSGTGGLAACPSLQWDVDIPEIASAEAVQVDAAGTIYVLGTHEEGAQTDAWLGSYDSSGAASWSVSLDPGLVGLPDGDELGVDLGLHSSGDVLGLVHHGDSSASVGLLRLDPGTRTVLWWSSLSTATVSPLANTITPGKVAVSDADVIVISGVAMGDPYVFSNQWVARWSELDGSMQWLTGVSIGAEDSLAPQALAIHDTEGIFSIAQFYPGVGSTTSSMARLTLDGVFVGAVIHPEKDGWLAYIGRAVAFDQSDDLVVAYTEFWSAPNQGILVERQDPSFNILTAGTTAVLDSWEHPRDVVVDDSDLAAVVGVQGPAGSQQGWLRVYDPAGSLVWDHTEAVLPDSELRAVALAPDGALLAAGRNGAMGWLRRYGPCAP